MTHHIDGPFPIALAATKDGAALDVTQYLVRAVFLELFEDADADSKSFGEEFADMHSSRRPRSGAVPTATRGTSSTCAWSG